MGTICNLYLALFLGLLISSPVYATKPGIDTLSTSYLNAIQHWLYGRNSLARNALRDVGANGPVAERDAARYLLLEELYFWPGQYQQYIQLADSMNFRPANYEMAKLLAAQPALKIQLANDSLSIPFILKNKGHIVVIVRINGKAIRLAVDSGAARTIVSNRMAKRMGIKTVADINVTNYEGELVPATIGIADSLTLNGLTVNKLPVFVAQMPIPGIDGLLGWDLLRQFALIIDYPKRQLTLHKSVPDSTLETNLLGGSRPMLLLRGPSGNQLNIFLDTGSNEKLRVSPTGLTKIGTYTLGRKLSLESSVGHGYHFVRSRHVRKLTISILGKPRQFRRTALDKTDEIIGQFYKDGLIGSASFRRGRLVLDMPNHHFSYTE